MKMCCAVSLICPSITSGRSCQFSINCVSAKCEVMSLDVCMMRGAMQPKFIDVYGPAFMSDNEVWQWCGNFEATPTDVHDADGQGRTWVSTNDLVQRDGSGDSRKSVIHNFCVEPFIFRNFIVSSLYHSEWKTRAPYSLCETRFPRDVRPHKTQQMGATLMFLQHYNNQREDFFNKIINNLLQQKNVCLGPKNLFSWWNSWNGVTMLIILFELFCWLLDQ